MQKSESEIRGLKLRSRWLTLDDGLGSRDAE